MTMVSFSAKDLCTRSCMQIKMFIEHPEKRPIPNLNIMMGEDFQRKVANQTFDVIGEEMRGTFIKNDICINFSNDIVTKNSIIEVKSVNGSVEDWYFNSSVVQCAIYSALLQKSDGCLVTSMFFTELGNPMIRTRVNPRIGYYLRFGDEMYRINVLNADKIVDFIVDKAKHCLSWDSAKEFDNMYKRKEYQILSKYFNVEKVWQ